MDVAALQTISNVEAYGELSNSQYELSGLFSEEGDFEPKDMKGVSSGILRLSSSLQELGIINDKQVEALSMLTAFVGMTYGAMLIYGVLKGMVDVEIMVQTARASIETLETLAIPYIGEIIVAAAVAAAAFVVSYFIGLGSYSGPAPSMLSTGNEETSIQGGDISSGTKRRQLANQLRSVT